MPREDLSVYQTLANHDWFWSAQPIAANNLIQVVIDDYNEHGPFELELEELDDEWRFIPTGPYNAAREGLGWDCINKIEHSTEQGRGIGQIYESLAQIHTAYHHNNTSPTAAPIVTAHPMPTPFILTNTGTITGGQLPLNNGIFESALSEEDMLYYREIERDIKKLALTLARSWVAMANSNNRVSNGHMTEGLNYLQNGMRRLISRAIGSDYFFPNESLWSWAVSEAFKEQDNTVTTEQPQVYAEFIQPAVVAGDIITWDFTPNEPIVFDEA